MLPTRYRLTPRADISETLRRGKRARGGCVVVHLVLGRPCAEGSAEERPARAAFAVGRSVGDSVRRHRVTRRLRAVMPPILDALPQGSRVVVRALPDAADASTETLAGDVVSALQRLGAPVAPPSRGEVVEPTTESGDDERGTAEATGAPPPPTASERPAEPRTGLSLALWWVGAPLRWMALGLLFAYRYTISPILPPTCRFHPSCSAYPLQAVQTHGVGKGVALGAWRLLRCNPFNLGGLDPVPPRGAWRPDIHPDGTPRDPSAVRFTDGEAQPETAAPRPT